MSRISNEIKQAERFEKKLANEAKNRDFNYARKNGLLAFGNELFRNGNSYDEFLTDVIALYIYPEERSRKLYEMIVKKYSKIEKMLPYEIMSTLASSSNHLENILIGYNTEKRRSGIGSKAGRRP